MTNDAVNSDNLTITASFSLLLHAHLPFVRHPEHPMFLEENWFFEAISETYLPLLNLLDRMEERGQLLRFSISLSPTLITMLADTFLRCRYQQYLDRQLALCEAELIRTNKHPALIEVVRHYCKLYQQSKDQFNNIHGNLLARFRHHADRKAIELLTSSATHAFLPLYRSHPALVRLQLMQGRDTFQKYLCRKPIGLWLPECGYYEGLEEHIKYAGYEYFIVSSKALECGGQAPTRGAFAPVDCANGSTAFICDQPLTNLIWDAKTGYPGKAVYRDFYRDIGFELPLDYLKPYLPCPDRATTGLKYYAIGKMGETPVYDLQAALQQAKYDAQHFCQQIKLRAETVRPLLDRPPLLCCAYDAELFGHWWREGPAFLECLFDQLSESSTLEVITLNDYRHRHKSNQQLQLIFSSWGDGGFAQSWLDSSNNWIYRHIYGTTINLQKLLLRYKHFASISQVRMLNQAIRELLLAMASDWPMIITSGSMTGYAERTLRRHLKNCQKLCDQLATNNFCRQSFIELEDADAIFPQLNYLDFIYEIEKERSRFVLPQ